jgi:hypothetical protein
VAEGSKSRTKQVKRMQRNVQAVGSTQLLRTGIADSFEMKIEVDEGFNAHRSRNRSTRIGKGVKGLRSQKVVACT